MHFDMSVIIGVAASLVCLVLAWRAYRGAAADHEARKREKEERDRSNRS
jgi:multisubunit Na+/H+ antiporter MnhC subunit